MLFCEKRGVTLLISMQSTSRLMLHLPQRHKQAILTHFSSRYRCFASIVLPFKQDPFYAFYTFKQYKKTVQDRLHLSNSLRALYALSRSGNNNSYAFISQKWCIITPTTSVQPVQCYHYCIILLLDAFHLHEPGIILFCALNLVYFLYSYLNCNSLSNC